MSRFVISFVSVILVVLVAYAAVRFPWEEAVYTFIVTCVTNVSDYFCGEQLSQGTKTVRSCGMTIFGFIIFFWALRSTPKECDSSRRRA